MKHKTQITVGYHYVKSSALFQTSASNQNANGQGILYICFYTFKQEYYKLFRDIFVVIKPDFIGFITINARHLTHTVIQ